MEVNATSHDHIFKFNVNLTSLVDSCRICMAHGLNMSCIFDAEKENIIEEIQFCTGITVCICIIIFVRYCKTIHLSHERFCAVHAQPCSSLV